MVPKHRSASFSASFIVQKLTLTQNTGGMICFHCGARTMQVEGCIIVTQARNSNPDHSLHNHRTNNPPPPPTMSSKIEKTIARQQEK